MAARRRDKRAGERNRLREDTKPAAATFEALTNAGHKPDTDVTLSDVERLFEWMDRHWAPVARDEIEAQRWWQALWSMRRDQLRGGCRAVENMPEPPTRQQFVNAVIRGDPNWKPTAKRE